jgi:hypothetical protein
MLRLEGWGVLVQRTSQGEASSHALPMLKKHNRYRARRNGPAMDPDLGVKWPGLKPTHIPFNVSYRQDPRYGGLTGLRNVPPSFMPRSKPSPSNAASGGSGSNTPPVASSGRPSEGQRPATAGSSRSGSRSGPSASTVPFRSVAQWKSVLQPGEASEKARGDVLRSGSAAHALGGPRAAHVALASSTQAPEGGMDRYIDFTDLGGEGMTVDVPQPERNMLSQWLDDDDEGSGSAVGVDVGEREGRLGATAGGTSRTPTHVLTARTQRPTSAMSSRRGKGKGTGPDSPRQLHYLDGIVVRMGGPLPRTCMHTCTPCTPHHPPLHPHSCTPTCTPTPAPHPTPHHPLLQPHPTPPHPTPPHPRDSCPTALIPLLS